MTARFNREIRENIFSKPYTVMVMVKDAKNKEMIFNDMLNKHENNYYKSQFHLVVTDNFIDKDFFKFFESLDSTLHFLVISELSVNSSFTLGMQIQAVEKFLGYMSSRNITMFLFVDFLPKGTSLQKIIDSMDHLLFFGFPDVTRNELVDEETYF